MASLSRQTVQRLAALRALLLWGKNGAYGPLRVQKTLFFADKEAPPIFTFKKWHHGQYSDQLAEALSQLKSAGRIDTGFVGETVTIYACAPALAGERAITFCQTCLPDWERALQESFLTWGYMANDEIYARAHDDPSYTTNQHGAIIFDTSLSQRVEFPVVSEDEAEVISDLVDPVLQNRIREKIGSALELVNVPESNWRESLGEAD